MSKNNKAKQPDHVIVSLNLSQEGQRTLKWAFNKCNPKDKVTILHVVEVLPGKMGPRCITSVPLDELVYYKEQIGKACQSMLFIYKEFYESNNISVSVKVLHGFHSKQAIIENVMLLGGTKLVFDDFHWNKRSALKFYVDRLHPKCCIYLIRGGSLVSMKMGKAIKSTCSPIPATQDRKQHSTDKSSHSLMKATSFTKLFSSSQSPNNSPSPSHYNDTSLNFRLTPPRYLCRTQISPVPRSPRGDESIPSQKQSPISHARNADLSTAKSFHAHSPLSHSIREDHPLTEIDDHRDLYDLVESAGTSFDQSDVDTCHKSETYAQSDSGSERKMNRSDSSSSMDGIALYSPISVLEKLKSLQDSYSSDNNSSTLREKYSNFLDSPSSVASVHEAFSSPFSGSSKLFIKALSVKNTVKKTEKTGKNTAKNFQIDRKRSLSHSGPLPKIESSSFAVEEFRKLEIHNFKRGDEEEDEEEEEALKFYLSHMKYLPNTGKKGDSYLQKNAYWEEKVEDSEGRKEGKEGEDGEREYEELKSNLSFFSENSEYDHDFLPDNYFKMYLKADLEEATNYFSQTNIIGHGGFSSVYKGILKDGKKIAVKKLKKEGGTNSFKEFEIEVGMLNNLKHRFIVSLLGFCVDSEEKWLVYDLMENGNLEELLQDNDNVLSWNLRYKIAIECARGLEYLHSFSPWPVIHRDIKAANILIDENMTAKVSDFGLAMWNIKNQTLTDVEVVGTFGYLAPEYFMYGKLSDKTDVFSFGIVLLELLTGKKPIDTNRQKGQENLLLSCKASIEACDVLALIDPKLKDRFDESQAKRMICTLSACLRHNSNLRPKMHEVVRFLEDSSDVNSSIFSSELNSKDNEEAMDRFGTDCETNETNLKEKEIRRQKLIALALGD